MKLWGGRFETGPSEVFERFSGSLDFDRRLIDADIRGSQAFARALERVGILSAAEREQLVAAFDRIRADARTPAFFEGAQDEDVHTLVIRKLRESVGGLADKIHTGRSRNEQVSLDTRLWLRDECDRARGLPVGGGRAVAVLVGVPVGHVNRAAGFRPGTVPGIVPAQVKADIRQPVRGIEHGDIGDGEVIGQ